MVSIHMKYMDEIILAREQKLRKLTYMQSDCILASLLGAPPQCPRKPSWTPSSEKIQEEEAYQLEAATLQRK